MLSLTATPGAPELCGLLPFNVLRLNICLERCEYFYFVALAVGVDLCCHLIREQVKLTPGELHIGQRKHTCCGKSLYSAACKNKYLPENVQVTLTLASGSLRDLNDDSVTGE